MTDFLLELRSEEIPARMQAKAAADLARLFTEQLAAAGLAAAETQAFVTPRRLALIARGLPQGTEAQSEEIKGPRTSAPPQALEGFLRKTGLAQSDLEDRDGIWFASKQTPGRATRDVLAEAIPAIVRAFPWPKSMRWGAASTSTESLRWVRPLHGIVAIFGSDLVPCTIGEVTSGYETLGHRFHHPGVITIGGADDYAEKLRACHVIVDAEERRAIIRDGAKQLAADKGLDWIVDEGLVAENAGLTEWPGPLLGEFDPDFLSVPREVIQLTLATNQKYFVLNEGPTPNPSRLREGDSSPLPQAGGAGGGPRPDAQLAPAFICVANIDANDGGAAIVDGNRKVLAARLADARHFWDQDRKKTLAQHADGLARITFHEKLGTVADKVDRVAKLARWLVEEGIVTIPPRNGEGDHAQHGGGVASPSAAPDEAHPSVTSADAAAPPPRAGEELSRAQLATLAEQAARLAKVDLVTEMVGEFPELQGVIGGYYACAEGLDPQVADAIRDHYKPVGQGDDVPTAPVTVAVSLADKLDTIAGFFLIGQKPTGSKDPFALRRAALGVLELVLKNQLRMETMHFFARAAGKFHRQLEKRPEFKGEYDEGLGKLFTADFYGAVTDFVFDRLKVQQRSNGIRHDLIDSVFTLGDDQPVRLLARVKALQAFIETPEGANLLAGYKRAANILKKEGWGDPASTPAKAGVQGEDAPTPDQDAPGLLLSQEHEEQKPLSYNLENAETALIAALDSAEPQARDAIAAEDFAAAMAALASLRAPIDTFFEEVIVNDSDPAKRAARLALLARIRTAVHAVADFAKIEG